MKTITEFFLRNFFKRNSVFEAPKGFTTVLLGHELLTEHQDIVDKIKSITGVPLVHWNHFYLPVLENFALYVQRLPASEAHHHSDMGGLLRHALEVVVTALEIRQGMLLPPGAEAEDLAANNDVWTYAVVTSAILHDIGKPLCDQKITIYDVETRKFIQWKPFEGAIVSQGQFYRPRFRRGRRYRTHERIPLLIAHAIIPAQGLTWLFSNREVVASWTATLIGDRDAGHLLADLVHEADCLSSAKDLTGTEERVRPVGPRETPLYERLLTGLRFLIDEKILPINANGAGGWVVDDELWLVSKRVLDELKGHLNSEGQTGIPGRNDRLMDELQQNGCLIVNTDKKAIWKARVSHDDWRKAHELTLLRLPVSLLWKEADSKPGAFDGNVTPIDAHGDDVECSENPSKNNSPPESHAIHGKGVAHDADTKTGELKGDSISEAIESSAMPLPPIYSDRLAADVAKISPSASKTHKSDSPRCSEKDTSDIPEDRVVVSGESIESDIGMEFLKWLRAGLSNKTMAINAANARVHVVHEGVLLVSPGIFRDFSQKEWSQAQKRFQKLKLNKKTEKRGENIHAYQIKGPRKSGKSIRGFLISDLAQVLPGIKLPPPNEVLSRISD